MKNRIASSMGAWLRALLGRPLAPCAPQGAVYEIFAGSFADSDGDGRGDLRGIAQKADYIAALGADAVWLTPVYPSPSYHGYDITDYCAVNPRMGTLRDFDRMLRALHRRGVRVILDMVFNHTSSEHPWFKAAAQALAAGQDSPYIEYYCFSREPGEKKYAVPGAQGWYYFSEFGYIMPDLNLDSEAVRGELARVMRFWLRRGVDGFRLDAVCYFYGGNTQKNTQFLAWIMQTARAIRRDVYVVGEAWTDDGEIDRLYDSGIDSLFRFSLSGGGGFCGAVRDQNGRALAYRLAQRVKGTDAPFLSNHDTDRSVCFLPGEIGPRRAAAAAYLFAPGIPFVYYGEELGMTGSGRDENKRLPMLWGERRFTCRPPEHADQEQGLKMGVRQQEREPGSMLMTYRRLIALRNAHPEMGSVPPEVIDLGFDAVLGLRWGRSAALINMSGAPACFPWGGMPKITGEGGVMLEGGYMMMAPWAVAVIEDR